jgi:serine/threonine-protein kinase
MTSDPQQARLSAALAGHYRLERPLGAGGMATVYLAHDLKHDRKVALKVLKPELAAVLGADRFVVEIRTTASLQHPHILPLFDSGTADGFLYYVMPYIEGETIRDRLNRETQFGVDDAIRLAREVAEALDYAHRRGIIHRDIKPENILLHDGRAMVMDFGIALAVSAAAGGRMTETGLSLGTPHYMSPEQATAEKELTPRSDVYSIASVLYEMLAGQPPHVGGAAQQVIMRIITEAARPVIDFRKNVPANVVAALAKALEKLPADRFATAKEFADALGNANFTAAGVTAPVAPTASKRPWYAQPLPYAAALAVSLGALAWQSRRSNAPAAADSATPVRFVVKPPVDGIGAGRNFALAISPDGRRIAFMARSGSVRRLHVQELSSLTARSIPGTEKAAYFAFSPDGKELLVQPATGGALRVLVESGTITDVVLPAGIDKVLPSGVHWSGETAVLSYGRIGVALLRPGAPVTRIPLSQKGKPYVPAGNAALSTDGNWVVMVGRTIGVAPAKGGEVRDLPFAAERIVAALPDLLLYQDVTFRVMAVPIDWSTLKIGTAQALEVGLDGGSDAVLSQTGTLVVFKGSGRSSLQLVDERGNGTPIGGPVDQNLIFPRLSPDGKRIAVAASSRAGGSADMSISIIDVASGTTTRLTSDMYADRPEWTPDGKRVLFRRQYGERREEIWWQPYDRSGPAEPLQTYTGSDTRFMAEGLVSPDGKYLMYRILAGLSGRDIWYRALSGDTTSKTFEATPADEVMPRFSPDGKWVAYTSNESGADQVFVRPFPGPGGRTQVSVNTGTEPVWAPDGKRLFYFNGSDLMAATVSTAGDFVVTARERLFTADVTPGGIHANYDVARDGHHFIMIRNPEGSGDVTVVLNWLADARKRMVP